MVFSASAPADSTCRKNSLSVLTTRFIELLQTSPTGVLDLQEAAQALNLGSPGNAHTRRIYDITNVLEGVGIIEKASKKSIQWKAAGRAPQLEEEEIKAAEALSKEIENLNEQERVLDMQLAMKKQSLAYTIAASSRYSYVHLEDLCEAFPGNTVLTVKAPNNTDINISQSGVYLSAMSGKIGVRMLEKDYHGHILAASIPQENQTDACGGSEDLDENVAFDTGFIRGEAFGGNDDPRFTHGNVFGDDFNYDPRGNVNHVSTVIVDPRINKNCEFDSVPPPVKRSRSMSRGESEKETDENVLVELDALMKAVQEIRKVDNTEHEIHEVTISEGGNTEKCVQETHVDNIIDADADETEAQLEAMKSFSWGDLAEEPFDLEYVGGGLKKSVIVKNVAFATL